MESVKEHCKKAKEAVLNGTPPRTICIGNEAGDADSVISSLVYAVHNSVFWPVGVPKKKWDINPCQSPGLPPMRP